MKEYKKRGKCYCCGYPYEKCELCLPSKKDKKLARKTFRQKAKKEIKCQMKK